MTRHVVYDFYVARSGLESGLKQRKTRHTIIGQQNYENENPLYCRKLEDEQNAGRSAGVGKRTR
jgi:hypothetical protein